VISYPQFEMMMKQAGVKASQVSKATGIPQSTFSDWKKGKSKPKIAKMIKLANYFNVPVESLLRCDFTK
jgi:repressor LexA